MPKITEISQELPGFTLNAITYLSNQDIDPSLVDIAIVQGDPPFGVLQFKKLDWLDRCGWINC